jgi:hypothetical protein
MGASISSAHKQKQKFVPKGPQVTAFCVLVYRPKKKELISPLAVSGGEA